MMLFAQAKKTLKMHMVIKRIRNIIMALMGTKHMTLAVRSLRKLKMLKENLINLGRNFQRS